MLHTIETSVSDIAHGMFDSPDYTVHKQFELMRWYAQKS